MSTRPQLSPFKVITDGDMAAASITSLPTIVQKVSMLSYQFSWAGSSPVGTIAIQASNTYALNPDGTVANAGIWDILTVNLAGSAVTSIPVSGNTGHGSVDIEATAFYALRAIYTKGSGTGNLQATVNGKVA